MALKALAAHTWHVRDAQGKGVGRAALHICIWPVSTCGCSGLWQ